MIFNLRLNIKLCLLLLKIGLSSTNSITDHDNSRNLGNSNKINSDNYVDNVKCNNIRELINVTNSDSNENNNRNLDSSNNFFSIKTKGLNFNSDESSSSWCIIRSIVSESVDIVTIRQRRNSDTDSNDNSSGIIIDEWKELEVLSPIYSRSFYKY